MYHYTTQIQQIHKTNLFAVNTAECYAQKVKILYIITKSNFGGAQRYVYDLATNLKNRHDVVVAFGGTGAKNARPGLLRERLQEAGIQTIFLPSFMRDIALIKEYRSFWEVLRLIKNERPDVLHLNSSKAGGIGALAGRLCGVPRIIFTSHGIAYEEDRALPFRMLIACFTWFTILLAHTTIAITKKQSAQLKKLPLVGHKIRLIYNGITPISFLEKEAARAELLEKTKTQIPTDGLWIGTISELTKNLGLHHALRTIQKMHENHPNIIFVIIGEGEEKKNLQTQVEKYGLKYTVFFTGYVRDAQKYLKAFDIFLYTPVKVGLPYVLLEAGYAQLPVVASNLGGIPEIITHDETGVFVNTTDENKTAAAIEKLLTHKEERERFGINLEKFVKTIFSLPQMVHATEKVYLSASHMS